MQKLSRMTKNAKQQDTSGEKLKTEIAQDLEINSGLDKIRDYTSN